MIGRILLASLPIIRALARDYTIINRCPTDITLFVNGQNEGVLRANGGSVDKPYPKPWSGFIYTDANGGNGATGSGTTRAGFYGEDGYYYVVVDPNHFNTGVTIAPKSLVNNNQYHGFCGPITCDSINCQAYHEPPTAFRLPQHLSQAHFSQDVQEETLAIL
ncbi:hypothetical protein BD779DRAFT_1469382 [Infundibulicybe gibba]|nr:hypothetical protein BD779DRAFT_1469382 [Infundibulicybe gibba]